MTQLTTLSPPQPSAAEQIDRRNRRLLGSLEKRGLPQSARSQTGSHRQRESTQADRLALLQHLTENSESSHERALLLSSQATVAIDAGQVETGTRLRRQAVTEWPDNFHLAQDAVGDALRSGDTAELLALSKLTLESGPAPIALANTWLGELEEDETQASEKPTGTATGLTNAIRQLSTSYIARSTSLDIEALAFIWGRTSGALRSAIALSYAAALSKGGQSAQAIQTLARCQLENPSEPIIALRTYALLAAQGNYDGACEALHTTVEALPSSRVRDGILRLLAHTALDCLRDGKQAAAAIEQQSFPSGSSHRLALRIRAQGLPSATGPDIATHHLQQWERHSESRHRIVASAALALHLRQQGDFEATQPQFDFLKRSDIGKCISDFCIRLTHDESRSEPSFSRPPPPSNRDEALVEAAMAACEDGTTTRRPVSTTEFNLLCHIFEDKTPKSATTLQLWIDQALAHGTEQQVLRSLDLWQQTLDSSTQTGPALCTLLQASTHSEKLELVQKQGARKWTPVAAAERLLNPVDALDQQATLAELCKRGQDPFKGMWLRYRARICESTSDAEKLFTAACDAHGHSAARFDIALLEATPAGDGKPCTTSSALSQAFNTTNERIIAYLQGTDLYACTPAHNQEIDQQRCANEYESIRMALSLLPHDPIMSGLLRRASNVLNTNPTQNADTAFDSHHGDSFERFFTALSLATALEFSGQHKRSIALYRNILEDTPRELMALSGLRRCLVRAGKKSDLKRQLESAVQNTTAGGELNQALCEWLDEAADFGADLQGDELTAILEKSPQHIPALRLQARNGARYGHPTDTKNAAAALRSCLSSVADRTAYAQLQLRLRDATADPDEKDNILLSARDLVEPQTPFVCVGLEATARRRNLNSVTVIALMGQARSAEQPMEHASLAIAAARILCSSLAAHSRSDAVDTADRANLSGAMNILQTCSSVLETHPTLAEELARVQLVLGNQSAAADALGFAAQACRGTARSHGFLYYAASLRESLGERQASMALFRELLTHDCDFKDAAARLDRLIRLEHDVDSPANSSDGT